MNGLGLASKVDPRSGARSANIYARASFLYFRAEAKRAYIKFWRPPSAAAAPTFQIQKSEAIQKVVYWGCLEACRSEDNNLLIYT